MNYESLENGKIYLVRKWSGENNQYHIVQFIQKVKNNRGLVNILMTREGGDDFQSDDWVEIDNNDIMNFNDFEILHRFYDTDIDYIKAFDTLLIPQTIKIKTDATLNLKNKKKYIPSLQDLSLLGLSTRELKIINNLVLPKTPKTPKTPKNSKNSKNPRKGGRKTRKNKNPKHT